MIHAIGDRLDDLRSLPADFVQFVPRDLQIGAALDVWLDPAHVYIFAEDGQLVVPAAYAVAA